jgi:hypothetical protein
MGARRLPVYSAIVQTAMEATLRTVVKSTAPITHRWAASVGYRIDDVRPIGARNRSSSMGVWRL